MNGAKFLKVTFNLQTATNGQHEILFGLVLVGIIP